LPCKNASKGIFQTIINFKNMKKMFAMMVGIMITAFAFAQPKPSDWAELKEFHGVMSQTFHPAEEGKLDPIKTRSTEMVEKAVALLNLISLKLKRSLKNW
jgi:hypothetical protein